MARITKLERKHYFLTHLEPLITKLFRSKDFPHPCAELILWTLFGTPRATNTLKLNDESTLKIRNKKRLEFVPNLLKIERKNINVV